MTVAHTFGFGAGLVKIGMDGVTGVVHDRLAAYAHTMTGRSTAPVTSFDPFAAQTVTDPYPEYPGLLTAASVWYCRRRGIWIIPGYDDVRAALRDHDALSSGESQSRFRVDLPMMITTDPPEHTRLRRLVSRAFTPRALAGWTAAINDVADALVDDLVAAGRTDVVTALAQPLPTRLIATMLGIPEQDHDRFLGWSNAMIAGSFAPLTPHGMAHIGNAFQATVAMRRYLGPHIAHRRVRPGTDLISMMTKIEGNDGLTDDEIFWFTAMLIVAGNETTTNLLSGLMLTFAQRPDVYAELRAHPELIPAAIEEQLRFVSPVQGFYRSATRDYTVGATTIPAGARVLLLFGAANRDPRRFTDPDTFDLHRDLSDHVAFGGGIHFCIGAHLSRLEASRALTRLLPRIDTIRLAGRYRYGDNPTMRGLEQLPLDLLRTRTPA